MKTKLMVVIADDLTGANDTGVQFARQGLATEVLLEGTALNPASDAAVTVVDTNSRAIPAEEAYKKVQTIAAQAQQGGFRHYYKKLDSTLRGNVGIELKAILDLGLHDFAFVMPAFPKNGRTTVGGQYLLNGVPLSATEIAKDPKCPVKETSLPELLRKQTNYLVGHIGISELTKGADAIRKAIEQYLKSGCKLITCDVWLDEHFVLAAQAVNDISERILWAGSAGLAECLPGLFGWLTNYEPSHPPLVIAGSVSAVTRNQVAQLAANGYEIVELEVADHIPWQPPAIGHLMEKILEDLACGKKIVLTSGYHTEAIERAKIAGAKIGLSALEVSETVSEILGWVGAAILRQQAVCGVVLTGGDTAVSVCRALGVTGIRVLEEIAPAIPLGEMKTSEGKHIRVVTKAGAFGNENALVIAVQKLQQRR